MNKRQPMDILNLSRFKIIGMLENEYDFQIQVEITSPPSVCPHCEYVANLKYLSLYASKKVHFYILKNSTLRRVY